MAKRRNPKYEECIRLRRDERWSLTEIHEATGVAKGTLSAWLRPYPLSEEERLERKRKRIITYNQSRRKSRGTESKYYRMKAGKKLTPGQIGRIGEAAILLRLALHGFSIYGSMFDGDRLDWVVEREDGVLLRIQVKMTRSAGEGKGLPSMHIRRRKGYSGYRRLTKADCDFVVAYDLFSDRAFVWTLEETGDRITIAIAPEAEERWDKLLDYRPRSIDGDARAS